MQNSLPGDLSALDRRDGYLEAMAEAGLQPWTFVPTEPAPFDAGRQAFEALALRKRGRAEAIIFANDNLAAGALLAGQRAGVPMPEHCALMGFGDYAISPLLLPSLTTIRPPARAIGEIAALRILETLGAVNGDGPHAKARLNRLACEVIARESA